MMRLAMVMVWGALLAGAQSVDYEYDAAGRLSKVIYDSGKTISYTYDPNGNLLERSVSGSALTSLHSASFAAGAHAPGMIATAFAGGIAEETMIAPTADWPTELGGVQLTVTDSLGEARLAPLYFVSAGQLSYLVPEATAVGPATIALRTAGGEVLQGSIEVTAVSPGLYSAASSGSGVAAALFLRVEAGGARVQELIFVPGSLAPVPVGLGGAGDAVYLLLFGTGIRGLSEISATAEGVDVPVVGAVPQGEFLGLDQVNIGPLPRGLAGTGEAEILLNVDGLPTNPVTVTIE